MTTNQIGMAFKAFIDDDTFASATATNVASAESIKAYVDNNPGGAGGSTTEIQYNNAGSLDGDPNFVTDGAGNLTAVSLGFSDTTKGIEGTATNDSAAAGSVGELVTSQVLASAPISPATATAANVTSISLTAGDWQVWGNVGVVFSSLNGVALQAWISTTSATLPDAGLYTGLTMTAGGISEVRDSTPTVRLSLSGTTTVYLSGRASYAAGSIGMSGGIFARRLR